MSTVDPTIARKARLAKRPSTARVVFFALVQLVGGFGLGFGWGAFGMFEAYGEPPWTAIVGIIGGLLLTILGSIGWAGMLLKRSDIGLGYGGAAVLLGAGTGLLVAASPNGFPAVGVAIAVALYALGALFLVIGVVAATKRRRQRARDAQTATSGMLTTATVSDKGYDFFRESSRIITAVTFTFRDLQGTQRWVQKTMVIEQSDPIVVGQETRLWYDPTNPGDTRSIVVELARDRALRR
ncbi:DUF3592 domain-containing protein [Leifsonia sp. WHRI 6310E]|uniref:DUF3592 domain-containing protein n=1 Tax=Leifsonia sp. WHRI 6310E TaxID=3162562 RepID=UPI0032EB4E62